MIPSVIWRFKREVTCPGCGSTVGLVQDDRVFDRRVFRIAAHCQWSLRPDMSAPSVDTRDSEGSDRAMETVPKIAGNPYGFPYPPDYEADFTDCPF